jgi:hypothetical protein
MRKLVITVVLVIACVGLLAAPAFAKQSGMLKPLVVTETMTAGLPDHPDTWFGSVSGDINGTQEGWGCAFEPGVGAMDPIFLGGASPGYNVYVTKRGVITQYNFGVFIDGTWEFRNVGLVTEATGKWAYLLGWVSYAYGFTPDPSTWGDMDPEIEGEQFTCTGYRVFLPPLPAMWGKLGVWKPGVMWPEVFTR